MFKNDKEKTQAYFTAKLIDELIDIQLDEIKELDGFYTATVTYISTDEKKKRICIDTEYIDEDDGTVYGLHEDVKYDGTFAFYSKVFYMWLITFANTCEQAVYFNGNV